MDLKCRYSVKKWPEFRDLSDTNNNNMLIWAKWLIPLRFTKVIIYGIFTYLKTYHLNLSSMSNIFCLNYDYLINS